MRREDKLNSVFPFNLCPSVSGIPPEGFLVFCFFFSFGLQLMLNYLVSRIRFMQAALPCPSFAHAYNMSC